MTFLLCDLSEPQPDLRDFQVIFADPPWFYNDQKKVRKDTLVPTRGIGACHHYDQMKTERIAEIPVRDTAAARCHLYLWVPCPLLPDAMLVMRGWGFRWATVAFVWVKVNKTRWEEAQHAVWQERLFPSGDAAEIVSFLDELAWFGPGFYTGSNVELVLLGRRGQPYPHTKGRKPSQLIFAPQREHSQKPEDAQDRVQWMYPGLSRRLELFGRRDRGGWTVAGNECVLSPYNFHDSMY